MQLFYLTLMYYLNLMNEFNKTFSSKIDLSNLEEGFPCLSRAVNSGDEKRIGLSCFKC